MAAASTTYPAFARLDCYYYSHYCSQEARTNRKLLNTTIESISEKLARLEAHADGFSARTFRRIHDLSGILAVINIIACIILFPYGLWFLYERHQHHKVESLLTQQTFYTRERELLEDWLTRGERMGLAQTERQQPVFPGVLEALEALKTHPKIHTLFRTPTTIEKAIRENGMDVIPTGFVYESHFADTEYDYHLDKGVAMKIYINGEPQIMALYYRHIGPFIPEPMLSLHIFKKTADGCTSNSVSTPSTNEEGVKNLITLFHQLGRFGHATVRDALGSSSEKLIHIGTTAAGATLPSLVLPVIREILFPRLS